MSFIIVVAAEETTSFLLPDDGPPLWLKSWLASCMAIDSSAF